MCYTCQQRNNIAIVYCVNPFCFCGAQLNRAISSAACIHKTQSQISSFPGEFSGWRQKRKVKKSNNQTSVTNREARDVKSILLCNTFNI